MTQWDHGAPRAPLVSPYSKSQQTGRIKATAAKEPLSHLDSLIAGALIHSAGARGVRGALLDRSCRRRRFGALPSPGRTAGWDGRCRRRNLLGRRFGRVLRRRSVGHVPDGGRHRPCKPCRWRSEYVIDGGCRWFGFDTTALLSHHPQCKTAETRRLRGNMISEVASERDKQ